MELEKEENITSWTIICIFHVVLLGEQIKEGELDGA